jgi:hypothetical protein
LCQSCHAEIDQGKALSREERRARMDAFILITLVELAKKGLVKP